MLGRLRMSTEDALKRYNVIAGRIFSKENKKWKMKNGTFKASTLEKQVEQLAAEEVQKLVPAETTGDTRETRMFDGSNKDNMGKS